MLLERYLNRQLRNLPEPIAGSIATREQLVALAQVGHLVCATTAVFWQGSPRLIQVHTVQDQTAASREMALHIAGSLTRGSQMPFFGAIWRGAQEAGLPIREVEVDEVGDSGLIGKLDRTWYILGDAEYMRTEGMELGVSSSTLAAQAENEGRHVYFLAQKQPKRLLALLLVADQPHPQLSETVSAFAELGIPLSVVTHEKPSIAAALSRQLGVAIRASGATLEEKRTTFAAIQAEEPHAGFVVTPQTRRLVPKDSLALLVDPKHKQGAVLGARSLTDLPLQIREARAILARAKRHFFWCKL